jgi:hypothetical protein
MTIAVAVCDSDFDPAGRDGCRAMSGGSTICDDIEKLTTEAEDILGLEANPVAVEIPDIGTGSANLFGKCLKALRREDAAHIPA